MLMPARKRRDLELRREALDEWAAFTLRGAEEMVLDVFQTIVLQLAEIHAPKLNEVSDRSDGARVDRMSERSGRASGSAGAHVRTARLLREAKTENRRNVRSRASRLYCGGRMRERWWCPHNAQRLRPAIE